jgi:GMP synthase (glutamine-hydrolysing)
MFLSNEGCVDRVLGAAPSPVNVVHRHHECFDLPDTAVALASSPASPALAFRCGRAYGVPFHLEVDTDLAVRWGLAPAPEATLRAGMAVLGCSLASR